MTTSRQPPHDLGAERAVISACLFDPDAWAIAGSTLAPDGSDFYAATHGRIWAAAVAAGRSGGAVDTTTVAGQLRASAPRSDDEEVLLQCTGELPRPESIETYCKRVKDLAAVRAVMTAGYTLISEAYSGGLADPAAWLDKAEGVMSEAARAKRHEEGELLSQRDVITAAFERAVARAEAGGGLEGYESGFTNLDAKLSGFCPGKLIIVAGRPGSGKSAFGKDLILGITRSTGLPALNVSLEMDREELGGRMIASDAGVLYDHWRNAELSREEWDRVTEAADRLHVLPIVTSDREDASVEQVVRWAKRLHRKHGQIGCVLVDYMQLLTSTERHDNRQEVVAHFARSLKRLSKAVSAPVIALSQLNRGVESRQDKRPMISDLRESGAVEQDADVILLCYRDEYYNENSESKGVIEVNVGKHRGGETGVCKLSWQGHYMRVANLESFHDPEDANDQQNWSGY